MGKDILDKEHSKIQAMSKEAAHAFQCFPVACQCWVTGGDMERALEANEGKL